MRLQQLFHIYVIFIVAKWIHGCSTEAKRSIQRIENLKTKSKLKQKKKNLPEPRQVNKELLRQRDE